MIKNISNLFCFLCIFYIQVAFLNISLHCAWRKLKKKRFQWGNGQTEPKWAKNNWIKSFPFVLLCNWICFLWDQNWLCLGALRAVFTLLLPTSTSWRFSVHLADTQTDLDLFLQGKQFTDFVIHVQKRISKTFEKKKKPVSGRGLFGSWVQFVTFCEKSSQILLHLKRNTTGINCFDVWHFSRHQNAVEAKEALANTGDSGNHTVIPSSLRSPTIILVLLWHYGNMRSFWMPRRKSVSKILRKEIWSFYFAKQITGNKNFVSMHPVGFGRHEEIASKNLTQRQKRKAQNRRICVGLNACTIILEVCPWNRNWLHGGPISYKRSSCTKWVEISWPVRISCIAWFWQRRGVPSQVLVKLLWQEEPKRNGTFSLLKI